jgi:hypothetical protein
MNRAPKTTGPGAAIPAQRFRAQATGCSPCVEESAEQGAMRASRVVAAMPAKAKAAVAPAQGYDLSGGMGTQHSEDSEDGEEY